MKLDRRKALRMAVATAGSAYLRPALWASPLNFPKDPRRRIAVATYPFRAMIIAPTNPDRSAAVPGVDLAGFARFVRSEFNVYGIEPLHSHFSSTEHNAILDLKADFDRVGVHTVNIPVDERADLCSAQADMRQASFETYRKWVDIAVLLESPSIRIGVPGCGGAQQIEAAANALRPVVDYAAAHNVIVNLENDDPVLANATRITAILRVVRSPYLRALPDFANSLMGGDEAFNLTAVREMFTYANNIAHVKDAEMINHVRRTVSLSELFAVARTAKYEGYYSMESDSDVDPTADTKHLIERCVALC